MKKLFSLLGLTFGIFSFAQHVALSKVEKVKANDEKIFYKIDKETNAEYLGEILVLGFSNDDVAVFNDVYKKAKEIGANTFALKEIEQVDGKAQKFDPGHYFINLYYTDAQNIPQENNTIYVVASSDSKQKIGFKNQKINLEPRHYVKQSFQPNETISVSSRTLLGSGIKITGKEGHPVQYFQVRKASVKDSGNLYGGLNLKGSDIIGLERSFAEFLTSIYQEQKID